MERRPFKPVPFEESSGHDTRGGVERLFRAVFGCFASFELVAICILGPALVAYDVSRLALDGWADRNWMALVGEAIALAAFGFLLWRMTSRWRVLVCIAIVLLVWFLDPAIERLLA